MDIIEGLSPILDEKLKKLEATGFFSQFGDGVITRSQNKPPPLQSDKSARATKRPHTADVVDDGAIPSTSKGYHPPNPKKAKTPTTELTPDPISPSASVILDLDFHDENLPDNDLFSEETKIFENENLKVFVVKEDHKRQKIFRLEDHLYVVRIKVLQGRAPLLKDVEDILKKAFEFMLKNLKTYYKPEDANLIYLTIYQVSY